MTATSRIHGSHSSRSSSHLNEIDPYTRLLSDMEGAMGTDNFDEYLFPKHQEDKTWIEAAVGGIKKAVVKGAKSFLGSLTNWKTWAMVGGLAALSFVPIVGPLALTAVAGYGLLTGGSKAIEGGLNVLSSTVSGDLHGVEKGFEDMTSGGIVAGLSYVGAKASYGQLKTSLKTNFGSALDDFATQQASKGTTRALWDDISATSRETVKVLKGEAKLTTNNTFGGKDFAGKNIWEAFDHKAGIRSKVASAKDTVGNIGKKGAEGSTKTATTAAEKAATKAAEEATKFSDEVAGITSSTPTNAKRLGQIIHELEGKIGKAPNSSVAQQYAQAAEKAKVLLDDMIANRKGNTFNWAKEVKVNSQKIKVDDLMESIQKTNNQHKTAASLSPDKTILEHARHLDEGIQTVKNNGTSQLDPAKSFNNTKAHIDSAKGIAENAKKNVIGKDPATIEAIDQALKNVGKATTKEAKITALKELAEATSKASNSPVAMIKRTFRHDFGPHGSKGTMAAMGLTVRDGYRQANYVHHQDAWVDDILNNPNSGFWSPVDSGLH